MDKVRVGLIGSGFVSQIHAEAFQEVPEAEIVATCGANPEGVAEFARKWNIPFSTTDYRRLLERKDINMVVAGLPNYLHEEVVVAAAAAGKHIVIEKPLANTLQAGRAMVGMLATPTM